METGGGGGEAGSGAGEGDLPGGPRRILIAVGIRPGTKSPAAEDFQKTVFRSSAHFQMAQHRQECAPPPFTYECGGLMPWG